MRRVLAALAFAFGLGASPSVAQEPLTRIERFFTEHSIPGSEARAQLTTVMEIARLVQESYVEPIAPNSIADWAIGGMAAIKPSARATDPVRLAQEAIKGIESSLDPYTSYMDAKAFADLQFQSRGSFAGVGMEVIQADGGVKVVAPLDDSPAAKGGIRAGDRITHVDGMPVAGLALAAAVERIRGPIGSQVRLTTLREGHPPSDVTLQRAQIRIDPVAWRVEDKIAYVRIKTFLERTGESTAAAISAMRQAHGNSVAGIVLDLRNNPGGLHAQTVEVADQFLTHGEIVAMRGRHRKDDQVFAATAGDITFGAPVVVIVNEGTASAAEILATALRQNGRAQLVGVTTFGKGNVQTIFPLKAGGALKLTTARYFDKNGQSYDGKGLQPDVVVSQPQGVDTDTQLEHARALLTGAVAPSARPRAPNASTMARFPSTPVAVEFSAAPSRPDDVAVIIGNADYTKHGRDVPDVNPAYADAEGAKRYAINALGVREGNVIFLKDATGAQMTRVFGSDRDHRGQLFDWVRPGKSRVFIYYAGHGAPGAQGGSPYLVPADADATRIELNGFSLKTLYDNLGKLPAESITVVLEACFSGASAAGTVIANASPIFSRVEPPKIPAKITVISAGAADQIASWEQDKTHSLFTKYFLLGQSGEADKSPHGNGDGRVALDELDRYLKDTLTYHARRYYGRDQAAQISGGRR